MTTTIPEQTGTGQGSEPAPKAKARVLAPPRGADLEHWAQTGGFGTGGALAVSSEQGAWTPEQRAALASAGVSEEVTEAELTVFLHECQRTGLDPFSKQIYLIGRNDKQAGRKVFRSQTGIDGYRVVAHRAGRRDRVRLSYADTLWAGPDGIWREAWLWDKPPLAAKVTVYRDGDPFPAIATLNEYAEMWNGNLKGMWARMPANQLAKCAEALALRKAFPNDLGGIYTAEEMAQADNEPRAVEQPRQAAAAPLRVPQAPRPRPAAGVERSRGQQDDEFAQPPQQIDDIEIVPETDPYWDTDAGKKRLTALHALIAQKSGPKTDEERHVGFTAFCKRPITSAKQMSRDEVDELMAAFRKASDYVAPAPSPEELAESSARAEAEALAATDEPDADRIEAAHRDAIETADSIPAVHDVERRIDADVSRGLIGTVARDLLLQAAARRKDALNADAQWQRERVGAAAA